MRDVAQSKITLAQAVALVSGIASTVALLMNYLFQNFITKNDLTPIEVKLSEMDRRLEQRALFTDTQIIEIKQRLDRVLTKRDGFENAKSE